VRAAPPENRPHYLRDIRAASMTRCPAFFLNFPAPALASRGGRCQTTRDCRSASTFVNVPDGRMTALTLSLSGWK